jgi:hypothetical protein
MDFDFRHIAVPFRMQPGLERLPGGTALLTPLAPGSALHAGKLAVLRAGTSRLCVPGFDPGPALAAIAAQARAQGLPFDDAASPLELAFEEDFVVLDGDTGTLPWLCVCAPSHWAPEDKLGLDFAAVHAPVADAAAIRAASGPLVALATSGQRWQRHVWTVSPSPRHDQHPRRQPRAPWPATDDAGAFGDACFLRVERQAFFPVGAGTRQAIFTIRVQLAPLPQAVDDATKAMRLHDALASMSDAACEYKGLTVARARLLGWCAQRMGPQ